MLMEKSVLEEISEYEKKAKEIVENAKREVEDLRKKFDERIEHKREEMIKKIEKEVEQYKKKRMRDIERKLKDYEGKIGKEVAEFKLGIMKKSKELESNIKDIVLSVL